MAIYLEGAPALAVTLFTLFLILVIPVSLIAIIASIIHKQRLRKKYLGLSVVKSEHLPPEDLSPAEVGYLFDSKIGSPELLATLFDLEQREIIKFQKLDDNAYNITVNKGVFRNLKPYEILIIDKYANNSTGLDLARLSLASTEFNKSVRESLIKKGFIMDYGYYIGSIIGKILLSYLAIVFFLFFVILFSSRGDLAVTFVASIIIFVFGFPLFLGLSVVMALINNKIAGHSGMWNKQAKELWPEIEGYREFVRQVEIDNIQFESEELKEKSKNTAMPYAIALGFNTKWQERFK